MPSILKDMMYPIHSKMPIPIGIQYLSFGPEFCCGNKAKYETVSDLTDPVQQNACNGCMSSELLFEKYSHLYITEKT